MFGGLKSSQESSIAILEVEDAYRISVRHGRKIAMSIFVSVRDESLVI